MLNIDSITPENLEELRRILSFNFENIFGKDIKITDDGGYYTADRLEDILQEIGGGGVDWGALTYDGTFGALTSSAVLATVREDAAGAGYFTVITTVRPTSTYSRSANLKITVDGVVKCNDLPVVSSNSDASNSFSLGVWYRYNTSYKVEHRANATNAEVTTTVLEATE